MCLIHAGELVNEFTCRQAAKPIKKIVRKARHGHCHGHGRKRSNSGPRCGNGGTAPAPTPAPADPVVVPPAETGGNTGTATPGGL